MGNQATLVFIGGQHHAMHNFQHRALFPAAELFLIKAFMQKADIPANKWLLGTGIQADDLKQASMKASSAQFDMVYRNIYRLLPAADTGLQLGKALNLSRWGMFSMALLSAKNLGTALETANRFRALLRSRFNLLPQFIGDELCIVIESRTPTDFPVNAAFAYEMFLGTLLAQVRNLLARPISFSRVELAYACSSKPDVYRRHLDCPVTFDNKQSAIYLPRNLLQERLPLANPVTEAQALAICEEEISTLEKLARNDIHEQVRQALMSYDDRLISLSEVAGELALSPRTLRRRLQQEELSFRGILQQVMTERAMHDLADPENTMDDIAHRCGFQALPAFRTAFRRWTGMTPSDYRKQFQRGTFSVAVADMHNNKEYGP